MRSATHRPADPGAAPGDPASASAADGPRRRPVPSPTGYPQHAPPDSPRRARPGTPAVPSYPRPAPRAPPAPGSHRREPRPGAGPAGRIRGDDPATRLDDAIGPAPTLPRPHHAGTGPAARRQLRSQLSHRNLLRGGQAVTFGDQ